MLIGFLQIFFYIKITLPRVGVQCVIVCGPNTKVPNNVFYVGILTIAMKSFK